MPWGFFGRGFQRRFDAETWDEFMATYAGADPGAIRIVLVATTDLFRRIATELAAGLGVVHPLAPDERTTAHLRAHPSPFQSR